VLSDLIIRNEWAQALAILSVMVAVVWGGTEEGVGVVENILEVLNPLTRFGLIGWEEDPWDGNVSLACIYNQLGHGRPCKW
jgi:hypothetical protein